MATTTTKNGAGSASRTPLIKTSQDELDRIRSSYQQKSNINLGRAVGRVGFWLLIVMILLYTLFPFYWAIVSSLKTTQEVVRTPPTFWPENLTWENYRTVFENDMRSEEHTSELQSRENLVCRLLLAKK